MTIVKRIAKWILKDEIKAYHKVFLELKDMVKVHADNGKLCTKCAKNEILAVYRQAARDKGHIQW